MERLVWAGVPARAVDDFLAAYRPDPRSSFVSFDSLRKYVSAQVQQGELTHWRVGIISQENRALDSEDLSVQGFAQINTIGRTRVKVTPHSIGALILRRLTGKWGQETKRLDFMEFIRC
jgi:hypothetical protein